MVTVDNTCKTHLYIITQPLVCMILMCQIFSVPEIIYLRNYVQWEENVDLQSMWPSRCPLLPVVCG